MIHPYIGNGYEISANAPDSAPGNSNSVTQTTEGDAGTLTVTTLS